MDHQPPAPYPVPANQPTLPPTQPAPQPASSSAKVTAPPANYRPLNVKDALSYLDQVKNQFGEQPEVYNRFLDIMKDFKSQTIDTPGVITRVSNLFRGHPNLIIGFNTFLPPGYRIEPTNNPNDPIKVTTPHDRPVSHDAPVPPQPAFSQPPVAVTKPAPVARGPVEFNHAISYVNKIKNRFANEPETYKQFLEILQTYQKEQKPIQEVYAQVQQLFKGAPDLLDEFKQFLPDTSAPPPTAPQVTSRKRAKPVPKRSASVNYNESVPSYHSTGFPSAVPPPQPPKKKPRMAQRLEKAGSMEELEFFDKCKRVIGNKTTYNEFLKVLNLFSQEIIEAKTLIERTEPFLYKAPELFEWFKKFVKYEDDEVIYNIPGEKPEFDLHSCRRSGHSYRRLPSSVPRPHCSGRDELCKEVLDDDWFSHPVYVSETGFVSHKKTPYEEAMYKCEEERYEFDLNIASNLQVISLLEPIFKRIQNMSPEERSTFKLAPGLGGSSVAIYERVIKKVYDRDRGQEVIDALLDSPAVVVPVLLKRLKQKDEEWKRSQREWNKVWREIDCKNFAKSLDHQGIVFKSTDRKAINVKSLVTEIEILQREQRQKRSNLANRYQLDFLFKKDEVFADCAQLLTRFVEGNMTISSSDEERISEFLKSFLPKFFFVEDLTIDKADDTTAIETQETKDSMDVDPSAPASTDEKDDASRLKKRNSYSLYANTNLYGFLRLFQMLHSRLLKMKQMSKELQDVVPRPDTTHPIAVELGLQKSVTEPTITEKDRYAELIKIINVFMTNEMDSSEFEERTRNMFWTSGYLIFTVDKLIQAIVKQLQLIVSDDKTMELVNMYLKDREKPTTSSRQEAIYRITSESLIQEENMFRFEFFIPERVLTIQLLSKDDHAHDDSITSEEKWSLYVDQFVQLSAVEGLKLRSREPFLRRTLPVDVSDVPPTNVETKSGLELKICVNTYKIFFVDNTEDYFCRRGVKPSFNEKSRSERFSQWLEDPSKGWKADINPEEADEAQKKYQDWVKDGNVPITETSAADTKEDNLLTVGEKLSSEDFDAMISDM